MVSDALVEEIRSRADLVELCGEHLTLKRVGKSYRGPCPLHGGDGPNFSVDPVRGIFKCFVCGEGGDVFAFAMKVLGLDFPAAVRYVGARVGIEVPAHEERREDPFRHLREVAAFAREWFFERLAEEGGSPARRHLERRGIDLEAAETYGLGFAPEGWRGLREAAAARGLEERHLLELGLLATSDRAEEPYDFFRGRLIFSIFDLRDRPIGFGGRRLEEADADVPKYVNSPDSPIFRKGETLYGLNWARHAMRREGHATLVEGYTDVLALHLHDHSTAVAGLGTAFTPRQARHIGRYARRAYLLYDSDAAGLRATFRTGDILLTAGVHPLVATLPEGEDPDSLVRARGSEALRGCLSDAVDLLERKLQILERQGYLGSVEGRRRAVDGLLSTLRAAQDPALRDIYLDRASERTGVRRETLVQEVARRESAVARRARRRGRLSESAAPAASRDPTERTLLVLLLRDATRPRGEREESLVRTAAAAGLRPEHFHDPANRSICAALMAFEEKRSTGDGTVAWEPELDAAALATAEELLSDPTDLTHPREIFGQALSRLLHRPQIERLGEIDRALEMAEEEQARELLREKEEIASELRAAGVPVSFLRRATR
ncbi:MAG: DNA primase [Gemmatimonadota bacterium]